MTGYSIMSADSLDAAVELAKGCPALEIGGAVDVYETIAMWQPTGRWAGPGPQVPDPRY